MKCARAVCPSPAGGWYNTSTCAMYCAPCARKINEHAPGLVVKVEPIPRADEWPSAVELVE